MSIFTCRDCQRQVDSDFHPLFETEDGYGLRCERCQDRIDEMADLEKRVAEIEAFLGPLP